MKNVISTDQYFYQCLSCGIVAIELYHTIHILYIIIYNSLNPRVEFSLLTTINWLNDNSLIMKIITLYRFHIHNGNLKADVLELWNHYLLCISWSILVDRRLRNWIFQLRYPKSSHQSGLLNFVLFADTVIVPVNIYFLLWKKILRAQYRI